MTLKFTLVRSLRYRKRVGVSGRLRKGPELAVHTHTMLRRGRLPRGLRAWMTIKLSSTGRKTRSLEEQMNKLRQQVRAHQPFAHYEACWGLADSVWPSTPATGRGNPLLHRKRAKRTIWSGSSLSSRKVQPRRRLAAAPKRWRRGCRRASATRCAPKTTAALWTRAKSPSIVTITAK
jgi:hypothetical protein